MPQVGIRRTRIDRLEEDVEELLDLIGYSPVKGKRSVSHNLRIRGKIPLICSLARRFAPLDIQRET